MESNSFLHLMFDGNEDLNIEFIQKYGSLEVFAKETNNLSFPSYLQPAFENGKKLYDKVNKSSPLYLFSTQLSYRKLITLIASEEGA